MSKFINRIGKINIIIIIVKTSYVFYPEKYGFVIRKNYTATNTDNIQCLENIFFKVKINYLIFTLNTKNLYTLNTHCMKQSVY